MLKFSKDRPIEIVKLLKVEKYPVDSNYQREPGAWTKEDEQFFIDSILRKIVIPKIYLHKKYNRYYIVDGQQRIETIRSFLGGNIKIKAEISKRKKDFYFDGLRKVEKKRFKKYPITASIITKGSDEEVRDLFRRLQRGKPLTEGERLNAMPGNIVKIMRKLTEHCFFKNSLTSADKKHRFYHIAAVFMYLEDKIADTTFNKIKAFFEKNEEMKEQNRIFQECRRNLNFMEKCYTDNALPTSHLGWLTSIYLFVRTLRDKGIVIEHKKDVRDFLDSVDNTIYDEKARSGEYKKFYEMIRAGTNSRRHIEGRNNILFDLFNKGFEPHIKEEERLFSSYHKRKKVYDMAVGKCQYSKCDNKKVIPFSKPHSFEIHHKKAYALGGENKYNNAQLVHPECHRAIHKFYKVRTLK